MSAQLLHVVQEGAQAGPWALAALRIGVGTFFACSGYNKLFNAGRHASLVETLTRDKVPFVKFNQWWVPLCELMGGMAVTLGLATSAAAAILCVICAVACAAEGKQRVEAYKPINGADCVADWLYLPEVVWGVVLGALVVAGGGKWQLGNVLFNS